MRNRQFRGATKGSVVALAAVAVAALVPPLLSAAPALASTGSGAAPVGALRPMSAPAVTNGLIALACPSKNGWYTMTATGGSAQFYQWTAGAYTGGVQWSSDGTEMVHIASYSSDPNGYTQPTVTLSEVDGSQDYRSSNYTDTAGLTDEQASFSPLAATLVFVRNNTVEDTPIDGYFPVTPIPQPTGTNLQPTMSINGDIAFEHVDSGGVSSIYLRASGASSAVDLGLGSMPRFSPDGTKIAFYQASTHQIYTMTTTGTNVTAIGPANVSPTDFRWSPDGTKLVLLQGGNVQVASTTSGSTLTSIGGVVDNQCLGQGTEVSWQPVPVAAEPVVRLAGADRIATGVAVSKAGFPVAGSAKAAVLARSDTFPDALAGTPLAVAKSGPMLLTGSASLDPRVLTELNRALGAHSGKTVYILGGTGALSVNVGNQLIAAGFKVVRLGGTDRFGTALQIAAQLGSPKYVFLATGMNYPDALAAGTAAGSYWLTSPGQTTPDGGVVLLTQDAVLPAAVKTYLSAHSTAYVTAVGGKAVAADPQADLPLAGADRYETAEMVAEAHFGGAQGVGIATGMNFPDALTGGALLAAKNYPLLLTSSTALPTWTAYFLDAFSGSIGAADFFGGTGVLPDTLMSATGKAIALKWSSAG